MVILLEFTLNFVSVFSAICREHIVNVPNLQSPENVWKRITATRSGYRSIQGDSGLRSTGNTYPSTPLQVHHSLELLLLWRHSTNEPRTSHKHQRRTAKVQDSSFASSDCVITSTFVSCSVCTRYFEVYIYTAVQKCHLTPKNA